MISFCAEYCGLNHAQMITKVHVISKEKFDEWYTGTAAASKKQAEGNPGENLFKTKGCIACHSLDGTRIVGPSIKGIYGTMRTVIVGGKELEVKADDAYIKKSILQAKLEVVKGYPPVMPDQKLSDEEIAQLIEFMKELK